MESLFTSLQRILIEERLAVGVTVLFVVVQVVVLLHIRWDTLRRLNRARREIQVVTHNLKSHRAKGESGGNVEDDGARDRAVLKKLPRLKRAWDLSIGAQQEGDDPSSILEPEVAFESSRLLPAAYNPRLDAAAPGIFTAFGIMGTFVGLIIGFLQVNPGQADSSIGPLIGGMIVAFVNSLLGVFLSINWAYWSRRARHAFDNAATELVWEVEARFRRTGVGDRLTAGFDAVVSRLELGFTQLDARHQRESEAIAARLEDSQTQQFGRLRDSIVELRESNERSSKELLDGLSPKLADAFKSLVATPFHQLTESVQSFERIVREAGAHQETIASSLGQSAASLSTAKEELVESVSAAQRCVAAFETATSVLQAQSDVTTVLVERVGSVSETVAQTVQALSAAADRQETLGHALTETTRLLGHTNEALQLHSDQFLTSTEHLDRAVAALGELATQTASTAVGTVKDELQQAISELMGSIETAARRAPDAHVAGSERVIASVDAGVSSLTERLAANIGGIAAELPTHVEALTATMHASQEATRDAYAEHSDRIIDSFGRATATLGSELSERVNEVVSLWPAQFENLTVAMEQAHQRTVDAYRGSTEELVNAIDTRVADLTDQLSSELSTLAARIPSEVQALNESMIRIRVQIQKVTRSMDDSVQQLAVQTPASLTAQLKAYDEALAKAMDRFSGTLGTWNRSVTEIQTYSTAMQQLLEVTRDKVRVPDIVEARRS
jgi:ABC-type transporter Mla subunit MlaD